MDSRSPESTFFKLCTVVLFSLLLHFGMYLELSWTEVMFQLLFMLPGFVSRSVLYEEFLEPSFEFLKVCDGANLSVPWEFFRIGLAFNEITCRLLDLLSPLLSGLRLFDVFLVTTLAL